MKVREVSKAVDISTERVHHILHEYLNMRKLSARWVPRLLTLDHERNRVTTSKECLHVDVQPQSERVFAPFRNRGRNMDPSQHTKNQGTIKTVSYFG